VLEWVSDYRHFWDQRLDRLEAYLEKGPEKRLERGNKRARKRR
jgi:hypothetical protein